MKLGHLNHISLAAPAPTSGAALPGAATPAAISPLAPPSTPGTIPL